MMRRRLHWCLLLLYQVFHLSHRQALPNNKIPDLFLFCRVLKASQHTGMPHAQVLMDDIILNGLWKIQEPQ